MRAVPRYMREGSYAMGATQLQTALRVVVPGAFSGIAAAYILGISRAIGETMVVAIAAGMQPTLTFNPHRAGGHDHGVHRAGQPRRPAARQHRLPEHLRRRSRADADDARVQRRRLLPDPQVPGGVLMSPLPAELTLQEIRRGLVVPQTARQDLRDRRPRDPARLPGHARDPVLRPGARRRAALRLGFLHHRFRRARPSRPASCRPGSARR